MNALRFPYPPLRERAARLARPAYRQNVRLDSPRSVCKVLGVSEQVIRRHWEKRGLDLEEADRSATRLGLHPSQVWPEEWAESERVALALDEDELLPEPPPTACACCTCSPCGPIDALARGGCNPWCLPCSFDVCGCPSSHDLS